MSADRAAPSLRRALQWTFLAAVAFVLLWPFIARVRITVANVGDAPLQNVRVIVSGIPEDLGSLAPMEEKSCWARARGETGVTLAFVAPGGKPFESGSIGYLSTGSSGSIRFLVNDRGVEDAVWKASAF